MVSRDRRLAELSDAIIVIGRLTVVPIIQRQQREGVLLFDAIRRAEYVAATIVVRGVQVDATSRLQKTRWLFEFTHCSVFLAYVLFLMVSRHWD